MLHNWFYMCIQQYFTEQEKKKSGTRFFFSPEKHKYNRRMLVSISTACWTPLTCTHTCINMGMSSFQHSRVSVVVT